MSSRNDIKCKNCNDFYTNIKQKWCKPCQINKVSLIKNVANWTSGDDKIDNFIQETQLLFDSYDDTIVEWIPYNQFNDIKEINKSKFSAVYSAIWKDDYLKIYGISQNPDTKYYILVFNDGYCLNCGEIYTEERTSLHNKWCKPCQMNNLKNRFEDWTSGNEKIDNFIQKLQLKINHHSDIIIEWIPYYQFCDIKKISKSDLTEVNSAKWKDGPFQYDKNLGEYLRVPYKEICFEIKSYSIEIDSYKMDENYNNFNIYGISQNPNTKDYIVALNNGYCKNCNEIYTKIYYKWCRPCLLNSLKINFASWTSGNKKIDELIQEKHIKIDEWNDMIVEWIPYNKFDIIKEISKSDSTVVYSAIWKDGPLQHDKHNGELRRMANKEVALKYLCNLQDLNNEFINVVKSYSIKVNSYNNILHIYGISQNPNTKDYIIVLDNAYCENFFNDSYCLKCGEIYTEDRKLNNKWCKPCQMNNLKNRFEDWTSGNEKINKFIQKLQLKINHHSDIIIEWIPYYQFSDIKKISKSDLTEVYSAKWKDGPFQYDKNLGEYLRLPYKEIALKYFYNLQNINDFLFEIKSYSIEIDSYFIEMDKNYNSFNIYGISQNPNTKDYIVVLNNGYCENCSKVYTNIKEKWCKTCQLNNSEKKFSFGISENENIDNFIQEMQLKISCSSDIIVEWIPYNQFDIIKEISKGDSTAVYSAIWKDGPLQHDKHNGELRRMPNKEVALKYLCNSQDLNNEFINVVKSYSIEVDPYNYILNIHGISQNLNTKDYVIVLDNGYCENCSEVYTNIKEKWCKTCQLNSFEKKFSYGISENEIIDNFIQEMQLKISHPSDIIVEWIPYNQQFDCIEEIGKIGSTILYSAIWKDGLILNLFGLTQNSNTNNYILVFNNNYCENCNNKSYTHINYKWCKQCQLNNLKKSFVNWASGNEKIDNFIQEMQLKINDDYDIIVEWIPYNQFSDIKEISKNDSFAVYSAVWKSGPLRYDTFYNKLQRYSLVDNKVFLKYFYSLQNITNEIESYSNNTFNGNQKIYGVSQNSNTKDYLIIFQDYCCKNCGEINVVGNFGWCKPCQINNLKQNFENWTSKNKEIDELIQKMQLKIGKDDDIIIEWISYNQFINIKEIKMQLKINDDKDIIVEWIPYNQFIDIKEINKNDSFAVYSASRRYYYKVFLKYFYSLQNITNEIESYSNNTFNGNQRIYGVSQNSNTKDYLIIFQDNCCKNCGKINAGGWCKLCQINNLKQNFENWTSKNKEIDEIIKEMQLKIGEYDDIIIEWISYNQFINIKEISKDDFAIIYSAIWTEGPLQYVLFDNELKRKSTNKKLVLKCLCNSQDINKILNEIREHSISNDNEILNIYGISQNPSTKNYIIVLQDGYCKDCGKISINVNKKWCKPCQLNNLEKKFSYGISENENIDNFIQEMQLRISYPSEGGFAIVYSAIWKDGPLQYVEYHRELKRTPNKKVALKCLKNSQNINNKFLNEVKEYSISNNDKILNLYGISQNPDTKDYIMILDYANNGNINNYSYIISIEWYWLERLQMLNDIIRGLKKIHGNNMVHRDFHTGNILLSINFNIYGNSRNPSSNLYISDMGLCGEVGNVDETKIYGVMPYVAPEVLKGRPYTKAADIYSFGMIIPKINENEVPKCYIDLMKRCWDSNPNNRPSAIEIYELIELFRDSCYYSMDKDKEIEKQFKEAEEYRKVNYSLIENSQLTNHHPQAYYTSRLLNPFTRDLSNDDTDCLDCMID
ncbi:hypothetical protein RhiirB3_446319 [Rhizophagus irregularis]|nr:hypothetical protein RhiirB3_446319 [Rhizophagus irregularis]